MLMGSCHMEELKKKLEKSDEESVCCYRKAKKIWQKDDIQGGFRECFCGIFGRGAF